MDDCSSPGVAREVVEAPSESRGVSDTFTVFVSVKCGWFWDGPLLEILRVEDEEEKFKEAVARVL